MRQPHLVIKARNGACDAVSTTRLLDSLKWLALCAMTVDHVNAALLARASETMTLIGRVAFPVFVFAAAFGALKTRAPRRYLIRLTLCALLAQPFFQLALGTPWWHLNTVFTLLWGVATVLAWRGGRPWLAPLSLLPGLVSDYGWAGAAAVPAAAVMLAGSWPWQAAAALGFLWLGPQLWGLSSYLVVGLAASAAAFLLWTRGQRQTTPAGARYAFYVFYPLHLAILAGLRLLWQHMPAGPG